MPAAVHAVSGASFEDLAAFLRRCQPGGHPVDLVRECVCRSCGGRRFQLRVATITSAVRRVCLDCGQEAFIADSMEWWDDDAEVGCCACLCGHEAFAAAVGFSLHEPDPPDSAPDVRWVLVGGRCLACGLLGVYEDWKVSWGPSGYLLDQA
ncbi:hypothetical protein Daura_37490 [Dactylosporangium aurantiacum]|uniref:Uncharacterized protein n=1 Tax=Dactylosporangium aurantiacum TaxID=35754 RepID=A0A9Q9MDP3_9ACTN|nr:hypothetical protein [Dactylosporangium aurantiacum]MDG6101888.1 hypothetical protein [Dactylosporangium aurantiacum]UWZ52314.1 hypothetical protein Daura_37490 [Dactylosporangium aurantiacum]